MTTAFPPIGTNLAAIVYQPRFRPRGRPRPSEERPRGRMEERVTHTARPAKALKHEKYLFLAHAGPYAGSEEGRPLLADRIEGLISQEHAKWVSAREDSSKTGDGARDPTG